MAQDKRRSIYLKTMNLAFEFGFIIALPLLAFAYAGRALDRHYHTNFLALVGIFIALTTSSIWFYRRIKEIREEMKNQ